MTELRSTARLEAVHPQLTPPAGVPRSITRGLVGLVLGAGLTFVSVAWSQGTLGFLSLLLVLGSLAWVGLGLIQHYAARFRRS